MDLSPHLCTPPPSPPEMAPEPKDSKVMECQLMSSPSSQISLPVGERKATSSDLFLMIDDLFLRKILCQICPHSQHFGELELNRFKTSYVESFLEPENDRLNAVLASNSLNVHDELLVYWAVENDTSLTPAQSWLQRRNHLKVYREIFTELLLLLTLNNHVEQSATDKSSPSESIELRQLFGERDSSPASISRLLGDIRVYLWHTTHSAIFGQEQEAPDGQSAKPDDRPEVDTLALFCSILAHIVRLLFECAKESEARTTLVTTLHTMVQKADLNQDTPYSKAMRYLGQLVSSLNALQSSNDSMNTSEEMGFANKFAQNFDSFYEDYCEDAKITNANVSVTEPSLVPDEEDLSGSVQNQGRTSSHSNASSGPSSGVGSLDSHHSSTPTAIFSDLFPGSKSPGDKLCTTPSALGASSDLSSSPAQFSSPLESHDNQLAMLLNSSCNLMDLGDMPKLIPPTDKTGNSSSQFGFSFNEQLDTPSFNSGSKSGGFNSGAPGASEFFANANEEPNNNGSNGFFSDFAVQSFFSMNEDSSGSTSSDLPQFTASSSATATPPETILSTTSMVNQCFTITMDTPDKQPPIIRPPTANSTQEEAYLRSLALQNAANLNGHNLGQSDFVSTPSRSDPSVSLCERVLLYRFIISQLLYDGHRSIANQLSSAERIKGDGSLLSPSDRLHTLVSIAIRREIDRLSVNNQPSAFHRHNSTGSSAVSSPYFDQLSVGSSQTSPPHQTPFGQHRLLQPETENSNGASPANHFSKNFYDQSPSQSSMGGFPTSPLSMYSGNNSQAIQPNQNNGLDFVEDSSGNDIFTPGEFYYSRNSVMASQASQQVTSPTLFPKSIDLSPGIPRPLTARNPAKCMLDSGANDGSFVLTEAGLKNLNQLAKLSAGEQSVSSLLSNGTFVRSPSALQINGVSNGIGQHTLSRSPLTISCNRNIPTPTTGNGKSHNVMAIGAKFGSLGSSTNQFSSPHGFCLGVNDEIVIADTNNHRICIYERNGSYKHCFGNPGKDEGQLWYPRKITMIPAGLMRGNQNPYYVICDRGMERSRMQIFTRNGNFVRKIPIRYIDIVAGIAVNRYGNIIAVDSVSPTLYVISDNGSLVEWFDCSSHMREPSDIAIFEDEYFICDFKGHCVVVLGADGSFHRKIGMEGLTSFPNGIDISPSGDIFVGDSHGNRFHVVIFNQEGKLISEHECPYVKVSRCCGLKLTKDNCIVTLAKNNHHVLVLNSNYPTQ